VTKVLVLLSTWNGERYLQAQLDSLLAQQFAGRLTVLIRDDGSTDGTVYSIKSRQDPRIRLVEGRNVGPRESFFQLLRMAQREDADYVALCDQDDVWRPDKMDRALSCLKSDQPSLYASSLDLVDENLQPIATYVHRQNRSFVSTLFCNYITGCTCVMNRAFVDQLPFPADPDKTIMHDWWLASIASLKRCESYDPVSRISYRQHASNHVGLQTGFGALCRKVVKSLRSRPVVSRFDHARELLASAGDRLSEHQRETISAFISGENSRLRRLRFVLEHRADIMARSALQFLIVR
jgi:glycosyltransferase involved in cell wall biosynthesis